MDVYSLKKGDIPVVGWDFDEISVLALDENPALEDLSIPGTAVLQWWPVYKTPGSGRHITSLHILVTELQPEFSVVSTIISVLAQACGHVGWSNTGMMFWGPADYLRTIDAAYLAEAYGFIKLEDGSYEDPAWEEEHDCSYDG